MSRVHAMLFDLDGTLLDSAPDLVASLNAVRASEDLPPLSVASMSKHASKGALGLLRAGMPQADGDTLEIWRQRFLDHYAVNSFRQSALFEGVGEVLAALQLEGIPWGIVTNKTASLTYPILAAAKLDEAIGCVVCGDTLAESKPHPAPVRLACGMLDVEPSEALFVGDDVRDIQAGRAAGTQTAAVFYGYGSYELDQRLTEGCFPVHHPLDLLTAIGRKGDAIR